MPQRARRVYWISKPQGKDLIVFDGGYIGGDIHVYEYKESHSVKEIEESVRLRLGWNELPAEYAKEAVIRWIEQNLGHAMSWELSQ